jgi:hypothetical protein
MSEKSTVTKIPELVSMMAIDCSTELLVVVVVVVVVGVLDFVVGVSAFVACCWRVGFSLFTCGEPAGSFNEASTVFS